MRRRSMLLVAACALATVMLVVGPVASALGAAQVRLINARGGEDALELTATVGGQSVQIGAATPFGQASEFTEVPAGDAELSTGGGSTAREALADGGSYTVIALPRDELQVLRNGKARAGDARLRVVHAAPELGTPDIRLGERTIAQGVEFESASSYLSVEPGAYPLAVARPNGGDPVLSDDVTLSAGTANTLVIAGSGGSPASVIAVQDDTFAPSAAPETGLGDLAGGGTSWLIALLAALAAGALGGALRVGHVRRSRP